MLPLPGSDPSPDEEVGPRRTAEPGSAKALGLLPEGDSTITRQHTSDPPPRSSQHEDEDGDEPATVLNAKKLSPKALGAGLATRVQASSDDDDLNETVRAADEDDKQETPVGLMKAPLATTDTATALKTPMPMAAPPVPVLPPESGRTRVAPIAAPTATAAASLVSQAWIPPQEPPVAVEEPSLAAKLRGLPPQKLALAGALALLAAALLMIIGLRSRETVVATEPELPATAPLAPNAAPPSPPSPAIILPPAAPMAQPTSPPASQAKAPPSIVRRAPAGRATSRATIPTHREQ